MITEVRAKTSKRVDVRKLGRLLSLRERYLAIMSEKQKEKDREYKKSN